MKRTICNQRKRKKDVAPDRHCVQNFSRAHCTIHRGLLLNWLVEKKWKPHTPPYWLAVGRATDGLNRASEWWCEGHRESQFTWQVPYVRKVMALGTYLSIYEAALAGCKMPTIERVMRNGRNRRSEPKQPERISPPLAAWCAGDESSGQSTVKSKIKQKKENNSSELRGGGGRSRKNQPLLLEIDTKVHYPFSLNYYLPVALLPTASLAGWLLATNALGVKAAYYAEVVIFPVENFAFIVSFVLLLYLFFVVLCPRAHGYQVKADRQHPDVLWTKEWIADEDNEENCIKADFVFQLMIGLFLLLFVLGDTMTSAVSGRQPGSSFKNFKEAC